MIIIRFCGSTSEKIEEVMLEAEKKQYKEYQKQFAGPKEKAAKWRDA